jgi:membrane-associated phospholipid phosphatase
MREASRTFRFGFVRGGIHYGWPSGHLAVNTAAVSSLLWFYPDNIPLKIAGGMYIAYLIFGVTAHEGSTMHWFSDVVAGTLIGGAIGSTVGRNFRQLYTQSTAAENSFELTPLLSFDRVGLTFSVKL